MHAFLPFDELSHFLHLLGLNSVLKPTFLPQTQNQRCVCKTYHFLLSLIRAISVKKMKITYSNWNHCWIISQIQMKLLSSAGKVEHSFFRFALASKFSLSSFLSLLFFKWDELFQVRRKAYMPLQEEEWRREKDVRKRIHSEKKQIM